MNKLKQFIAEKRYIEAKIYIAENRERFEEIVDCLLSEIDRLSPKQLSDCFDINVDLKDAEPTKEMLSDWEWSKDSGSFGNDFKECYSRISEEIQKRCYEIACGYDSPLDELAKKYGLVKSLGETDNIFRRWIRTTIDEKSYRDIERHRFSEKGTAKSIINALMELDTVIHAEIREDDFGQFRTTVHITDESQLKEIAAAIHDNRNISYSVGTHFQELELVNGKTTSERFDYILTNSL